MWYQWHRNELLRKRGGLVTDHPEPVAATWSLSFQRAQEKNPATADLLCMCAFLAPDAIPEEILTAGASALGPVLAPVAADPFQLNQALEALRAYSLIRRHPREKTLSIHRLVQTVLQETLEEEARRTWRERAMQAVHAAFPQAKYETWSQCERMLSQALFATQAITQEQMRSQEAGQLSYETASYLQDRARYEEAESLYLQALHIWEQLGLEHPQMARLLNYLAMLYRQQGKYAEAEPLLLRELRIREQLGREHPDVVHPLNSLAGLYSRQGRYVEAEMLLLRALHIWEQHLGPEHPEVAIPLNGLAGLYREQGKYAEAEPLFQRALHIRVHRLGPQHPDTATSLANLAELYRKQGKHKQAEPLLQRALAICEQHVGPEHPDT